MSALNLLQSTTAEVRAVACVLHEALDDHPAFLAGITPEPDGYYNALAEAVLEAAKDARLHEFVLECVPDIQAGRLRAVPDPLDAALGQSRR